MLGSVGKYLEGGSGLGATREKGTKQKTNTCPRGKCNF